MTPMVELERRLRKALRKLSRRGKYWKTSLVEWKWLVWSALERLPKRYYQD